MLDQAEPHFSELCRGVQWGLSSFNHVCNFKSLYFSGYGLELIVVQWRFHKQTICSGFIVKVCSSNCIFETIYRSSISSCNKKQVSISNGISCRCNFSCMLFCRNNLFASHVTTLLWPLLVL
uniref:Uncharacterized protein n=1 Tax=Opuntia streptacantha TaxID=393608 RepID=A0A7C9DQ85_OPUST